jgi:hypothetical protein
MKDYPEKKLSHSDTMGVINDELTCFSPCIVPKNTRRKSKVDKNFQNVLKSIKLST